MTTNRKLPSRKSPGRPLKDGPHMERKSISLYPEEWGWLDDVPGKNRSDKIRRLIAFYDPKPR